MSEEHRKATLIWRKTTWKHETLYTLIGWENVLSKDDLPAEYTDRGPHFWEAGNTIYISNNKPKSYYADKADLSDRWTVPELYPGQSLEGNDFEHLIYHLRKACEWLRRVKLKVSESEEIVVELDPLPDTVERHPIPTDVHDEEEHLVDKGTDSLNDNEIYKLGMHDAHQSDAQLALVLCFVSGIVGFIFGTVM